ncbi:AP-5 complex subunit beta-1 isoform X2 [Mauremys reevesii]|uniref:AP-5 complex subunit beta-1 isoform X2 n=1 Tax=Mauremys reevesii TaxID=260615 RepID=UPI00193FE06E|nr:AP-5 complex subunit beta-1 isoform X2 [Mauremys reevesii]
MDPPLLTFPWSLPGVAMSVRSGESWAQLITTFRAGPTAFLLACGSDDTFLAELLQDLSSERISEQTKVSMLTLLLEFPTLLCPDPEVGEQVAGSLLANFAQLPHSPKLSWLRRHLLVVVGTVLISTEAFGEGSQASRDYLSLLLHLASDLNDQRQGPGDHGVRAAACESLRELECCYPGLFSRRLDSLRSMQQQELTPVHQGYTLLYSLALRNAVLLLARRGEGALSELLAGNEGLAWEAVGNAGAVSPASLDRLLLLPTPAETKELKSVLSQLLDGSYLLTPPAQSQLLWHLAQVVCVIRTQSPAIFKAQLVRLFGTAHVALLHASLQLKGLFTDSLFTAEDEAFLLRRLVGMAQHPSLPSPLKLFYLDCLLHFPENRPLGSGSEEGLPVLLTPRLASCLFPSLFNDPGTMLARLNLLSLVCLENQGPEAERGVGYIFEHVLALADTVAGKGGREATGLFFRAAYLFARYFGSRPQLMGELTGTLVGLYRQRCSLAPNLINLLNETQAVLDDPAWPTSLSKALQELTVGMPLLPPWEQELGWHLKLLARVAKESGVPQGSTLGFLQRLVRLAGAGQLGDWYVGQALLSVCRNLLQHQPPPAMGCQLAELLQDVSLSYPDVDVQDRARFYYILLSCLSGDKLGAVLAPGGRLKARTLSSSIMADSENFAAALTVHPAPQPLLLLQREAPAKPTLVPVPASQPCPADAQEVKACCRRLLELHSPARLSLTYRLLHTGSSPERLFCLLLRFECSDNFYEPVPDVCVPCLSATHPSPILTLHLQPRCPYPTELAVSALYTTQTGLTYCSQLEPLRVAFPDIFLPLALPVNWDCESRRHLFDTLWSSLCPEGSGDCAESLFCWPTTQQPLGVLVQAHFASYLVAEESGTYKIAIALPPHYHVLLQAQGTQGAARVTIRTDNWKVLPHLSAYLRKVVVE